MALKFHWFLIKSHNNLFKTPATDVLNEPVK